MGVAAAACPDGRFGESVLMPTALDEVTQAAIQLSARQKLVLQCMRKEKWTFPAEIELEYKIPEGSDAVKEVAKCVQYSKEALA